MKRALLAGLAAGAVLGAAAVIIVTAGRQRQRVRHLETMLGELEQGVALAHEHAGIPRAKDHRCLRLVRRTA